MGNQSHVPDMLLSVFVTGLNRAGAKEVADRPRLAVTLYTDGGVISGEGVPAIEWIREQAREHEGLAGIFSDLEERWRADLLMEPKSEDEPVAEPAYIHLRNAGWFPGPNGSSVPADGALIRVALSHVAGWSFGSLMRPKD